MRGYRGLTLITGALGILLVAGFLILRHGGNTMDEHQSGSNNLSITSQAFKENEQIPAEYTCKGQNVSPPLAVTGVPKGTRSLALIMHDPDAPGGDYVHWLMWDIPSATGNVAANSVPVGAIQGVNSAGQNKYMGPCPPSGTHRYVFELYALDKTLGLPKESDRLKLESAMQRHLVAKSVLTGVFSVSAE